MPTTTPLKSESITFLVKRARTIAKTEGMRERGESSICFPRTLLP